MWLLSALMSSPHWFVEVVAHRVSQSADSIVEDEQVLGLVLVEGGHEDLEDIPEVGHQLCACLLLQRGKGTAGSLLDPLVGVQHSLQQLVGEMKKREW